MAEHDRDEQHRDDAVDDFGYLHAGNSCSVEREHQYIAAHSDRSAAEHYDPIDHFLTGVEAIGRRMLVPDDTAALPEPFDINPGRHIPADPHQEDHEYTEREREAEIIVRVLRPLGPGGEGIRPDEGQQQRLPERDVEAGKGEEDEAGCRHPMH